MQRRTSLHLKAKPVSEMPTRHHRRTGLGLTRRTQAERTALSDDRLMSAALRLIAERGDEGTSLAAIGEAAGYSRGLVNHRFGSKEGLLWALVERLFEQWGVESVAPAVGERVGIEAINAAIDAMLEVITKKPERLRAFYGLLFQAAGPLPALRPKVIEFHRRQRATAERWIRAGIKRGSVRADVDPRKQAALFMSAIRGASYLWLLDPDSFDLNAVYEDIRSTFTRNLKP